MPKFEQLETWEARFQALKARHAGKPLDERRMKALMVAEVAAAWLDWIEQGGGDHPDAEAMARQLNETVDALLDQKAPDRG